MLREYAFILIKNITSQEFHKGLHDQCRVSPASARQGWHISRKKLVLDRTVGITWYLLVFTRESGIYHWLVPIHLEFS